MWNARSETVAKFEKREFKDLKVVAEFSFELCSCSYFQLWDV